VLPFILGALWWQDNQASVEVNFGPTQAPNFLTALASQHKQPNNLREWVGVECSQHCR
jgi:hypothetical protein